MKKIIRLLYAICLMTMKETEEIIVIITVIEIVIADKTYKKTNITKILQQY